MCALIGNFSVSYFLNEISGLEISICSLAPVRVHYKSFRMSIKINGTYIILQGLATTKFPFWVNNCYSVTN